MSSVRVNREEYVELIEERNAAVEKVDELIEDIEGILWEIPERFDLEQMDKEELIGLVEDINNNLSKIIRR